jgi:outer membrane protein insertion porin family
MISPLPLFRLCLLCLAASLSLSALQAQVSVVPQAAKGPTVREVSVQFKGVASLDAARVKAQMATREGAPFSDENVERDIRALYATGAIDNVDIQAQPVGDGVRVVVTLIGRGGIGEIAFEGNQVIKSDTLRDELKVKVGDPVDDVALSAGQQKIRELYERKGYSEVAVTYEVSPSTKEGFSRVAYRIDEGLRGFIGEIRFEGNNALAARRLKAVIKSREKTFYRLWGKAGKLDSQMLLDDIKAIEELYQDNGYAYVQASYRREQMNGKYAALVFEIREGSPYSIASVDLRGITIFRKEELTPAILSEAGQPYSGSDVRGDAKMVRDYYGSRGYADANVETILTDAGPGRLHLAFEVTEGRKSSIRKVNISGNVKTKDEVIRRELSFAPGEELNTVKLEAAQTTLDNMNYFEGKNDANPLTIRPVDTETEGLKDVEINVTEKPTGSVNFGAGFSSVDSLVGFVDVTQTNFDISDWGDFRGAGQRFNLNLRYGLRTSSFNTSWTEPWFMGQKLALTVSLFYQNLFYLSNVFDQTNAGASIGLRKPLGEHDYIEATYSLQQTEIKVDQNSNPDKAAPQVLLDEDGKYVNSKLEVNYVHDTRDSVFITRKGHKFEAGLMGTGLGGDVKVMGANLGGQQHFSLPGDTVLSFEGMARVVNGWGDVDKGRQDVPIFERLFLGGAYNVRGFQYREAGPKTSTGKPKGEAIGGNVSLFGSVEYGFPIMEKVRGALFWDTGMIDSDVSVPKKGKVANKDTPPKTNGTGGPLVGNGAIYSNIGVGVRLFLPIGPIRVDVGLPVVTPGDDTFVGSSPQVQFNMGYRF